MSQAVINKLVIIGVGLLGGSVARALRAAGQAREIVGVGRSVANLERAVALGVIDRVETSLAHALRDADMVVLAQPVEALARSFADIAPYLRADAVVTDVGSVKGSIVAAARAGLQARLPRFVPAHPMAGSEKSGAEASSAELFRGARVILTPLAETDLDALERARALWETVGATISVMDASEHDAVLAATSHLPHMLAFMLVDLLAAEPPERRVFDYIGNGFRDMTRIAASDPVMWRDICQANRDALLEVLGQYRAEIDALSAAIAGGSEQELMALFERARTVRTGLNGG